MAINNIECSSIDSNQTTKRLQQWVRSAIAFFFSALSGLVAVSVSAQVNQPDRPDGLGSHEVVIDDYHFRVRDGYELTKVADAPLVTRPTVADWDDQGRLVVVESAGAVGSVEQQLEDKPHKLVRLVDEDGDGVFDRRIVAAEDLSFYSGVLCDGIDIYVSAPPSIWKLTDQDGDGVCEKRTVWHDGGTLTYCANDLHGPYASPDGWMYWCKGAFGEQTHDLIDGTTLVSSAAHILRKRRGGGPVDIVSSGGMDNPIELAFLPNGERFFSSTFLQHPSGGRRDGIAHAVRGSVFGKRHHVIDGLPRTGDLMPVMTQLGPAAPSGLTRLRYGESPGNVLVCAQFNLHKVSSHTLIADGATYKTIDEDLVSCNRLDFHPTDVIEDEDGSLILLDTGDWYDLCCPSSGFQGKRSTGGAYRLRKVSDKLPVDGVIVNTTEWNAAAALRCLSDARFLVRDQAADWLVQHPRASIESIRDAIDGWSANPRTATRSIHVLSRLNLPQSNDLLNKFLDSDFSPDVQHAALNALTLQPAIDLNRVHDLLSQTSDLGVKRAAAECLGFHGTEASFEVLMAAFDNSAALDRVLEHSLLYALIQLDQPQWTLKFLHPSHPLPQQRAALVVLNQIAPHQLCAKDVFRLFCSHDAVLRSVASDVMSRRKAWSKNLVPLLASRAVELDRDSAARRDAENVLTSWMAEPAVRELWKRKLHDKHVEPNWLALLTSIPVTQIPRDWDEALATMIASRPSADQLLLADWLALGELDATKHPLARAELIRQVRNRAGEPKHQFRFAAALPAGLAPEEHGLSVVLVESLLQTNDSDLRAGATAVLQKLTLHTTSATALLARLNEASTLTLPTFVEAIARSDVLTAEKLLEQLSAMPLARTLPPEFLRAVYADYSKLKPRADEIAKQLSEPLPETAAKLQTLLDSLPKGDMVRGTRVFHGTKAACASCHELGDVGGKIGPELTKIGKSRSRLALLEAIVYPSSHIAQGYRGIRVLTVNGEVHNGLIQRESDEELELATGIGRVVTIPRDEIEERVESDISIMPNGLDGSMSQQELADVLEMLATYTAW